MLTFSYICKKFNAVKMVQMNREHRESIILENEGRKLFGVLHTPVGVTNTPGVFICHGLAGHKTGKHRVYVDLAERLAQNGISTFRLDFRGSGDSEGAFQDVTVEGYFRDALKGLDFLVNHPIVNPERIGIYGRSFGGVVAINIAERSGVAKSLVLWCPMFSCEQWLDQWQLVQTEAVGEDVKKEMMRIEGQQGSYEFFDEFFKVNVTSNLKSLDNVPLLHIHGENDNTVSVQQASQYEKCRQGVKAESKFIKLPNTDHDFSHISERMVALGETQQWFLNTL